MPHMSFVRIILSWVFVISIATAAAADTVRVVVDRALVWTSPSGISVVITQLRKDQTVEVVRRVGDWYEIVLPRGLASVEGSTGFIRASQVVLQTVGPRTAPTPPGRGTTAARPRGAAARHPGIFNIDATYRVGRKDLTRSIPAFADVFAEEGTIATNYGNRSGFAVSVLFGQRIRGQIGLGVGGDYYFRKRSAALEAHVPHPFFFNQLRTATFETGTLLGHEAAVHVPVLWMPPAHGSIKILVYGGPSAFRVSQTVVTDVSLDEQYPYDVATVTGVATDERKGTRFGYHAGGDVSYFFTRSTGVGGGVRYTHATLKFDHDAGATTTGAGGDLQAVVGLRFKF